MAYYAFIVGVNQDWPEQRHRLGDVGLARCLSHDCGIPKQNIMEVYDERATRSNILHALETLLDRRNANLLARRKRKRNHEGNYDDDDDEMDTLLFYYGGHGKREVFCTERHSIHHSKTMVQKEPWIKHSEIIELLEQKFIGGIAVCIIDCCHSGTFGQEVLQKGRDDTTSSATTLNVSYCCLMSVPPADIAGEEWTMSECFVRAFKGELLCSGKCYYLSTKKGKHPIKKIGSNASPVDTSKDDNTSTDKHNIHPSWGQVIEYLADEMARIKCDRLTTLFRGKRMEDGKFLLQPCIFGGNSMQQDSTSNRSTHLTASISRDLTWMDPLRCCKGYAVNDGVCVKWVGYTSGSIGSGSGGSPRIGWFPGRILSIISTSNNNDTSNDSSRNPTTNAQDGNVSKQSTALIELHDVICNSRWTMVLPLNRESNIIHNVRSFGFGFDPQPCVKVISHLAKSVAYFDTTVLPHTRVKVLWVDGEWYSATTLSRIDLPWEEVYWETSFKVAGPCVPVRWDEDDSISFVPTKACVVVNKLETKTLAEKSARNETYDIQSPLDAMLASLTLEGKKLQDGVLDQDGLGRWEAYDAEDCVWSLVHLMNIEPSSIPLKALASHFCYQESEQFSLVFWESDASISLVPLSFLRQRAATAADDDNDNECSDDENSVESTDHDDLRKYIDEACYCLQTNHVETETPTEHKYLELGSMAAIMFGIGFKLGFRSRR